MKRILLTVLGLLFLAAQPVAAADIPVKAPAAKTVVATAYNWSGSYFGGHLGYGWAKTNVNDVDNYSFSSNCPPVCGFEFGSKGLIGGVQAGYNWQSGTFVYGTELDFSFSGINHELTIRSVAAARVICDGREVVRHWPCPVRRRCRPCPCVPDGRSCGRRLREPLQRPAELCNRVRSQMGLDCGRRA